MTDPRPRKRLRLAAVGAALGVLFAAACGTQPRIVQRGAPAPSAPNILVFVTDDQRADDTLHIMPSVRRWFADKGTTFTNAFATTPLCCPSRASIMTGQYAHNHRVLKNSHGDRLPQQRTVQRALWMDGYQTFLAGKYLNGWDINQSPPFFDRWAMQRWGYFDSEFNVNGVVREIGEYSVKFIGNEAIASLEQFELEDDTPWFGYVAPFSAHKPYAPQERYAQTDVGNWYGNPAVREKKRGDKPEFIRDRVITKSQGRDIRRKQLRTLLSADDTVGRIMSWLRENDELQDTLAFFVSDNGRSWGEHGVDGKRTPYSESVGIALIARWPGHFARDGKDGRLVTNLDIPATIWKAARLTPGHQLDGLALQASTRRERVLLEHWGHFKGSGVPSWASIRTNDYQYVEYYGREGRRIFREYYDLRRDSWQLLNVLGDRNRGNDPPAPELSRLLARDRRCSGRGCP